MVFTLLGQNGFLRGRPVGRLKQPESPAGPQDDLELPFLEPLVKRRLPGRLPGEVASAGFVGEAAQAVLQAVQF